MERYANAIDAMRAKKQISPPLDATLESYLRTGDAKALKTLTANKDMLWLIELIRVISEPEAIDDHDKRLIRLLMANDEWQHLDLWLVQLVTGAPRDKDAFTPAAAALRDVGFKEAQVNALAASAYASIAESPQESSLARHLLALDEKTLRGLVASADFGDVVALLTLLASSAPHRLDPLLPAFTKQLGEAHVAMELLEAAPQRFEELAAELFRREQEPTVKFSLGQMLWKHDREKYGPELIAQAKTIVTNGNWHAAGWMIEHLGPGAIDAVQPYLVQADFAEWEERQRREVVDLIARQGGDRAKDALLTVSNGPAHAQTRALAIEHLIGLNDSSLAGQIESAIEQGLGGDARAAARFAAVAVKSGIAKLRDRMWAQLGAKSKIARAAAAEALAAGDPEALDRASALLAEESKDLRWGAVLVLAHLATPSAADVLLHRLPREAVEEIRNEMTKAVRNAGVGLDAIVKALGPTDLGKLRERGRQHKAMPVKWLKEDELPDVKMLDGTSLDRDLVRFLLHRQAGQNEPVPDPEAAPLYMLIDRHTSGDFALKLLDAYFESERGKADAWALIAGGMLGDNRVITLLASKIRGWADGFDQKLGEFGIEALALNGLPAALMAVQSIADKYKDNPRKKYNVIGTAAQEALELAAKRMGISMDELGDRIVPSLGFEPGRPRVIEAGGRTIEATIGLDFKLSMKDAKTGKKAVSIPKAAPPEVQAEFKGLGKLLVEAAKSQSARLEALMVRQHRWPAPRWDEIFLRHPLLFPFAVRLVWGAYDANGKVVSTFRALPDRTLTNAHDEPVEFAKNLAVGIVHPLDLTREQIDAWQTHLGDYEIAPPFLQIERQLITVPENLRAATKYERLKGATMNALSFRSKVERSGWTRGAVVDGGTIGSYRKRFSTSGIDAFVVVDGMVVYAYDPSATVTIAEVLFLPMDTKPADFTTSLMKLADVPEMVFSETVGDLMRITGKIEAPDGGGGEAGNQDPTASQTV